MASTFYLDLVGGSDAADGLSFANRWKTISGGATAARIGPGDTIRLKQSPQPTTLSQTLAWTTGNKTAILSGALNLTISTCDAAWTASANVVDSNSATTKKNGTNARSLAIAGGFTTGIVAYFATGTLNCSAYQQVCFWIRCNAAVAASTFRLDLCSDTIGAVPVNSFTITDAHQSGNWLKVVMDAGSALGSSIKSVALVALLDPGTVTVLLDNIFVAKAPGHADELTLHTLISKANGAGTAVGDVQWWPIMSIDGTTIEFDGGNAINSGSQRGYYGTTATVTTYARQPIVLSQAVTAGATIAGTGAVQDSGTAAAYITFSGGWDTSNMSTQTGDTFLAVNNGFGFLISTFGRDYIAFSHVHGSGMNTAFSVDGLFGTFNDCGGYNCDGSGVLLNGSTATGAVLTQCVGMCNTASGFSISQNIIGEHVFSSCSAFSNNATASSGSAGFAIQQPLSRLLNCVANNNGSGGYLIQSPNDLFDLLFQCTSAGNSVAGVRASNLAAGGRIRARKCTFSESTKFNMASTTYGNPILQSQHDGNVTGTHVTYGNGFTISSDTSTRHTASGYSAKIALTNAIRTTLYPVKFKLADMPLVANQLVTITAWVRRDTSTSTVQLIWPGNQIAGVDADVSASASGSINTWELLTITFTPTAADGGTLFLYCSYTAGTPNIWVDDLSLSQPQP